MLLEVRYITYMRYCLQKQQLRGKLDPEHLTPLTHNKCCLFPCMSYFFLSDTTTNIGQNSRQRQTGGNRQWQNEDSHVAEATGTQTIPHSPRSYSQDSLDTNLPGSILWWIHQLFHWQVSKTVTIAPTWSRYLRNSIHHTIKWQGGSVNNDITWHGNYQSNQIEKITHQLTQSSTNDTKL